MTKRDNDYFARRLQKDHPQVWGDYQAGVYKTLTEARRAYGRGFAGSSAVQPPTYKKPNSN